MRNRARTIYDKEKILEEFLEYINKGFEKLKTYFKPNENMNFAQDDDEQIIKELCFNLTERLRDTLRNEEEL